MFSQRFVLGSAALVLVAGSTADAQVWPRVVGEMSHIMVQFDGTDVHLHAESNGRRVLRNFGDSHTAPADVLDGMWYNDQYGWLADGFFSPPTDAAFWVRELDQPAALETYEGGMRMMRADHTYDPIFGTDGSPDFWKWSGIMTHNWYASSAPGAYDVMYEMYVGDAITGAPLAGYGSDTVTLRFIPAPGSLAMLGLGTLAVARRRR